MRVTYKIENYLGIYTYKIENYLKFFISKKSLEALFHKGLRRLN